MTESSVVVQVRDVSKRFVIRKEKSLKERLVNFGRSNKHKEDFYALRDVNLDIQAGTTVGLIGPNGSGKSTLLKTIGGIIQPTTGEVKHRGRLAALLELGAGFHPDLTGRENVYLNASILGLSRKETDSYFDDIVEFSGIEQFIDTQVKFYSSGMYVRLAFSVAVHVDPDILIVDEVLAVGDEPFQRKCMDKIKSFQQAGKTIILVTHSMAQVGEICDRAVVLEHGAVMFDGDPGEAIKVLREGFEEARQEEEAKAPHPLEHLSISEASLEIEGQPVTAPSLGRGEPLQLSVLVDSVEPVDDVVVGMGIETPLGQVVFGTNTELLEVPISSIAGPTRVQFDLGEMHLGDGQYIVHASVGTRGTGEVARLDHAAHFYVRTGTRNVGLLDAPARVTIATAIG
ncbi:ABC transporter ATP-binding protein [Salinibacterium sp. ZJ454]|uniref:ABC transporter ATP-binding protein n=1 Tax=Salinibacterium sp. ZJ454 TaxID=2708339 RepID=UPI001FBA2366|nr:ABC transporter ATP-binding protein [Salinibacterium sp. ZJ454]